MIEVRAATGSLSRKRSNNDEIIISGYAIKWGEWSKEIREDGKRFYECINKGAFTASLREKNQFLLEGHDVSKIIASVEDGTLTLKEDSIGLSFKVTLRNRGYGVRVYENVLNGNLSGVSVGMDDITSGWSINNGKRYRTIKEARLGEISLTGNPAYPCTAVRSGDQVLGLMLEHMEDKEQFEDKKEAMQKQIDEMSKSIDKMLKILD